MYNGNELLKKEIIATSTGEVVERVSDLVIDAAGQKVLALLADEGGLFAEARIIPFESIQSIGKDAVMIPTPETIVAASEHEAVQKLLNSNQKIIGLKVVTKDGQDLGKIVDIYFSEQTGVVEGYEVSGGIAADIKTGRAFLPAPKAINVGKDVVIVPNETVQLMENQVGGLQGAAREAGQKVRQQGERFKSRAQQAAGQVRQEADEKGDIYRERTKDLVDSSRGELEQGWQEVQQTAGQIWERVKETTGTLRDQTTQEIEERRIKMALGRPTDRIILDQEDNVVLDRGEIITNKAVQAAREAGVLDLLLSSAGSEDKVKR